MQEFGTHLGGTSTKLEFTPPCIWVGVIMAPTVEAGLYPPFLDVYTSSKNETLAMFQGAFFPVVMFIHVGTIQLRKLTNCSVTNGEASLNFFLEDVVVTKAWGPGSKFFTHRIFCGVFS